MTRSRCAPTGASSGPERARATSLSELDDGRVGVYIRQVVRSLEGSPISRGHFLQTHRIEGDLISRMDIICQRFLRAF